MSNPVADAPSGEDSESLSTTKPPLAIAAESALASANSSTKALSPSSAARLAILAAFSCSTARRGDDSLPCR